MKKILLIFALVFAFLPRMSGQTGQIGTGTGSAVYLPIYSYYGNNYSQQIYTAAEMTAAVGTNNMITAIRFYVNTVSTPQANYNDWVVYLGNTTQNNFATTTSWIPLTNLQQVYSGILPTMSNGNWVEIPLANPFIWDGTSNFVVAVDENATGYSSSPGQSWGTYNAGTNRGILYYSDGTNPNPASPPSASSRYSAIPRIQLVSTAVTPCTATPPTNIAITNIGATGAMVSWNVTSDAGYIVRYREMPSGAPIEVIIPPFQGSYMITGLLESTPYEVEVAAVCAGVQSAWSPPVTFTTTALTYCSAGPTSTTVYEYMSNVTVTPNGLPQMVSNSTLPPPFYTDYSADPTRQITLIRGLANNNISITRVWTGSLYNSISKAWIDYNRNGVFEDHEIIINTSANTNTLATASFTVPPAGSPQMYSGNLPVKMRVILAETTTSPNPCGTFTWGEVEDYFVKFIDLQPCSTTAPVPTVSSTTHNSAYVAWMPTANATYKIRWREGTTGAWQLPPDGYVQIPVGQSWYTILGLTEQTAYQLQIESSCGSSSGSWGPIVNFTTPPLTYCPMVGSGTNDYISNVTVTPNGFPVMSNNSLQTNYISYPTPVINLEIGSNNNKISVSKSWVNGANAGAVTAWIDFNRNGTFETSEQILVSPSNTTTPVANNNFTVPSSSYTGPYTTTMRVVLRRGSAPVMCTDPANGEVEDYAVRLRPCSNDTPTSVTINTITHNSAIVNWTSATNNNAFILEYREVGGSTSFWTPVNLSVLGGNPPYQITGLNPATEYEVRIAAVCGTGGAGAFTPIRTFITRCDPTPPTVTITNVTSNSAVVTWNPLVPSASYVLEWRAVGSSFWNTISAPALPQPPANSYTLTGLSSYVTYEVHVANICDGETDPNQFSNPQVFTTTRNCDIPPPGLTITQLNPTSAVIVWEAYTGAGATSSYILKYRKVGIPSWTTINVNTNTYTLTGLLELTKYEMQVANVCSDGAGNFTPTYYFTTPTVIYCGMQSSNGTSEYISNVKVTPNGKPVMSNSSVGSSYSDYTNVPANFIELIQGSEGNEIVVEKRLNGGAKAGVAVWIDFNRNGTFDLNERILADGPNENLTASSSFSVPSDAFVSMTDYKYVVMRVAMSKDGIPVNCTSFSDGEVEDYTVRISKLPVPSSTNQDEIMIYPNPVKSVLNVKNISKKANYKIYSAAGQLISNGIILNNKIDVSRLTNGMYVIDIEDVKGSAQKKFIKE